MTAHLLRGTLLLQMLCVTSSFLYNVLPILPHTRCDSGLCYFGTCQTTTTSGGSVCQCSKDYLGDRCHKLHFKSTYCGAKRCFHGDCILDYSSETFNCMCYIGYSGADCASYTTTMTSTQSITTTTTPSTTMTTTTRSATTMPTTTLSTTPSTSLTSSSLPSTTKVSTSAPTPKTSLTILTKTTTTKMQTGVTSSLVHNLLPLLNHTRCDSGLCYFGTCQTTTTSGGSACQCNQDYLGDRCHKLHFKSTYCGGKKCFHGDCILDYSSETFSCICHIDYSGAECDIYTGSISMLESSTMKIRTSSTSTVTLTTPTTTISSTTTTTPTTTTTTTTRLATTMPTTITTPLSTTPSTPFTSSSLPSTTKVSTSAHTQKTSVTILTKTTTTKMQTGFKRCAVLQTLTDISSNVTSNTSHIGKCSTGSYITPETFVFEHCPVTSPIYWSRGVNVIEQCDRVPLYTAIATFTKDSYITGSDTAGIFLGCLSKGFKIGIQRCDNTPSIEYIEVGDTTKENPHAFHTIL